MSLYIHNSVLISRPRIYLHDPTSWCSGIKLISTHVDVDPILSWSTIVLRGHPDGRTG